MSHAVDTRRGPAFECAECLAEHLPVEQAVEVPKAMLRILSRFGSQCGQGA